MVALLIALALHGYGPVPRRAIYVPPTLHTRSAVHYRAEACFNVAPREWVCPMPAPAPPHHKRRSK